MKYSILVGSTVIAIILVLFSIRQGSVAVSHIYADSQSERDLVLINTVQNIYQDYLFTKRQVCSRYNLQIADKEDELYALLTGKDPLITIPQYFSELPDKQRWAFVLYDYKTYQPFYATDNIRDWMNDADVLHKKLAAGKTIFSNKLMLLYGITGRQLERELLSNFHEKLHSYEFSIETELFVRKVVDWAGGDNWMVNLICPGSRDQETKFISSHMTDAKGHHFYAEELYTLKMEGKAMDYLYETNPTTRETVLYLSYSFLFPDFDWVITMRTPSVYHNGDDTASSVDYWIQQLSFFRILLVISACLFAITVFILITIVHIDLSSIKKMRRRFEKKED